MSILFSSISSHLLLFNDLELINGFPLLLQSDIVGEASDDGAKQPFCIDVFVADANAFCDEILVDDNCSFNELTSFSASVALCTQKKKKSRKCIRHLLYHKINYWKNNKISIIMC